MSDYNNEQPKKKLNWDKDAYKKMQDGFMGKKSEEDEEEKKRREQENPGFMKRMTDWMSK